MRILTTLTLLCLTLFAAAQKKPFKYIDPANMDKSVKPGDDFYTYANGNWVKRNPVPASKIRWGSFNMLEEESSRRLHELLEDAAAHPGRDRKTQIIGAFYASGMDSLGLEAKGFQPIKSALDRINGIKDKQDILKEMGFLRTIGLGAPLFSMNIQPDRKNVQKYMVYVGQGGTSLPDRDYYLKDDSRSAKTRTAFSQYMEKLFGLVGEDPATAASSAAAVMKIEMALAKIQMSRVEMRDPYKVHNKIAVADLSLRTPGIDWPLLLQSMKITGADTLVINNPAFFVTAGTMLTDLSLAEWKAYLRWNILRSAAPFLSSAFVNADFEYNSVLTGQKEQTPRWQRMSTLIDRSLGDLVGELYVEKYFKPEAKQRMITMVDNLQSTFAERIKKLDWMSAATKIKAQEKLAAFARKIAYPDKWKTYTGVTASNTDLIGNLRNTAVWSYDYMVNKIGKPVDRTEMGMTPPTINAQYSSIYNDLTFPAGILQFPFFDFGADDAVNYGGIGAVIGHEMTHGFDDQGSKSDAAGNLKNWWATEDSIKFKAKSEEVVQQYNNFVILDTMHVNGKLTLGENLADLGGLSIAYEAFTKTKQFRENKKIDGFTPAQRFFLSWAQIWRSNILPDNAALRILTDSHSPGLYRGNGPIVNIDGWYKAFNVQPGDKLYKAPEARTRIW